MPAQVIHVHADSDVVIRKRSIDRYTGLVFCGILFAAFVGAVFVLNSNGGNEGLFPAYLLILLFLFLAGFAASGPCEIHLDGQRRTYAFTRGLPLIAKTVTVTLDDVGAVVCAISTSRAVAIYQIFIEWKNQNRKRTMITYTSQTDAYPILDAVKLKLNIPTRWDE